MNDNIKIKNKFICDVNLFCAVMLKEKRRKLRSEVTCTNMLKDIRSKLSEV